jgi:hypothetical protein
LNKQASSYVYSSLAQKLLFALLKDANIIVGDLSNKLSS